MKPWTVESTLILLDRPWLRVHQECLRLPTGATIQEFHRLETPSWAAALVCTEAGEAVLVEQHRRGLNGTSLELPAGVIEPGEPPLEGVMREVLEETGYEAKDWRAINELSPEPSRSTARAHLFFAKGAWESRPPSPEPSENIRVVKLPIDALLRAADDGTIQHAVHVAAIFTAVRRGWLG